MSRRRVDNFTTDTFSDGFLYEKVKGTGVLMWEDTANPQWPQSSGRLKLTNNGTGMADNNVWRINGTRMNNGAMSATWNTSTSAYTALDIGAVAKMLDPNNFLLAQLSKTGNAVQIYKYDNGAPSLLASGPIPNVGWTNGTLQVTIYVYGNTVRAASNAGTSQTDFGSHAASDALVYTLTGADATKFGDGVEGNAGFRIVSDGTNREWLTNCGYEPMNPDGTFSMSNSEDYVWFTGDGALDTPQSHAVASHIFNNDYVVYMGNVSPANSAAGFTTGFQNVYGKVRGTVKPIPGDQDWAASDPTRHEAAGMYDDYWGARGKPDGNHHHYAFRAGYFEHFKIIVLNTEELGGAPNGISASQLGFLDYHLTKDPLVPKIVVGHRPVWSATTTAGKGNQSDLEPIWDLMKGRSLLYIAGHSHNYQRIIKDEITQIVAGAGGIGSLDPVNSSYGYAYANDAVYGLLRLRLGTQTSNNYTITGTYVDAAGVALDPFTINAGSILPAWQTLEAGKTALDNPWKFILTSADAQTTYGEITNARDRTVSDPHMGAPSLSCTIRVDHELALTVLNEECLIKAYRGNKLVFHGPIVTVEEVGESNGQSIRITAAGAWWRASKRIIPASTTENGLSMTPSSGKDMALAWILNYGNGYNVTNGSPFTDDRDFFTGVQWGGGN